MDDIDDEELELIVQAIMLEFGLDDDLGRPLNGGVANSLQCLVNKESWRRLDDPYFAKHFRMDTTTFEMLLLALGNHLVETNKIIRRPREPLYFSLLMVLWVLATADTFRAIAVKFGVAASTVHFHYLYMILALRSISHNYVRWPTRLEAEVIAYEFEDNYGYPGVMGCIDGSLIPITAPKEQKQRYVDRHHKYSITVQAVCDHNLIFRDVYVGQPGSVGDARTFRRSPLGRSILRNQGTCYDKHLLGDGAYKLTSQVMVPYRNRGILTRKQRTHNYYLSKTRSHVERAFALLKGKWRRLKLFHSYCLPYAIDHITACIVLHNFVLLEGEKYEGVAVDLLQEAPDMDEEQVRQAAADGELKRDFIADLLYGDDV